jgi:hypothetical protein
MKKQTIIKSLLLALGLSLLGSGASQAQVTVKVDSTKNWGTWMNVFNLPENGGGYVFGQGWAAADLRAGFAPNQATASRVVLQINTNTYNPADGFWNLPDGTPQKNLEANFYVDVASGLGGQDVTFIGTVESNTLPVGWTCEAVIKEFAPGYAYLGDTRAALVTGQPFSVNRVIGAGNIVQYGFLMYGPNTAPGSAAALEGVSIIVDNADPAITQEPVKQRTLVGGSASFTVTATGSTTLSYQWKRYGTNLVNQPGKFTGATSATLNVLDAQTDDATTYTVSVNNTAGTADSVPARLRVLTPEQFANLLDNPSFEEDVIAFQTVPEPWFNFTGSALLSGGDFIWDTAFDGTNVVQVYNGGQYSGIYQDVPAAPGQIFTGDCWLFQSSLDPLTAPIHEAFLEVQFWGVAGGGPIAMYQSTIITNSAELQDEWLHLFATNGVAAGYAATSTSNTNQLVAPEGTARVRFQITAHAEGGGSGSVFVDAMRLQAITPVIKNPVTISVARDGGNIVLSWPSENGSNYQVVYKDSLSDANWTTIGPVVVGDGNVKTASFSTTGNRRFYSVITQ